MKKGFKVVKNWEDANELISKGFKLNRIDRDKFDRSNLIFLFVYQDGIEEELNNISKQKKLLYSK